VESSLVGGLRLISVPPDSFVPEKPADHTPISMVNY